MFLIRKIYDDSTPANQAAIAQAQSILRTQFPGLSEDDVAKLPHQLHDPLKYRFHAQLLAAEDGQGELRGFALLLHAPDLRFAYLEYISTVPGGTGGGIGGALYERVREEAHSLDVLGLFYECLPDDESLSPDPEIRAQNAARLKFYERYGARPLANTAYETPVKPGDDNPPYLVMDPLGSDQPLGRSAAQRIVRAILERKYGELCPADYIEHVIHSFKDDPVQLRAPRYIRRGARKVAPAPVREQCIALIINDKHDIHHVRERGYVESPVRIKVILQELEKPGFFKRIPARKFPQSWIGAVHERDFVQYLKHACALVPEGKSVYPYVFPIRNATRPPHELPLRAGYYCIDTFTPLNRNAWLAALGAVDCALTGAQCVLDGHHAAAYALVRPPGHHAERRSFGGFCYFNSAAVAANYLSRYGRVAVLDIDYHHGNGTENIFYQRADVLTVSLHGHPRVTYPYFSGFEDERGEGAGLGYNLNIPLPEGLDGAGYRQHLARALKHITRFAPGYLVLALGLDTAKGDPTGSFTLTTRDFHENGRMIGALGLPVLVTQEGGYRTRSLGQNARHFFEGLWQGMHPAQKGHSNARRSSTDSRG